MAKLTAIGEILIDMTQTGTDGKGLPLFTANPGGAPANVAVAAARLGCDAAFIGKVGRDALGQLLMDTLSDNGVDISGVSLDDVPTTVALVALSPEGERSFSFLRGADRLLSPTDVRLPPDCGLLHFGSVSLTAEPARSATLAAAAQAKQAGAVISYDPNYRAALWPGEEEAVRQMRAPLPMVDVLKLSREELPLLSGTDDLEAGSRVLAEAGVSLVMVTLGGDGVFYRWQDRAGTIPGVPVQVADTTGAGDAFCGAVLSRLLRRADAPLHGLTEDELRDILSFANRAAALKCTRGGAIPAMPFLAELENAHFAIQSS